jgi:glycyl-tRNA synthetase beta chain
MPCWRANRIRRSTSTSACRRWRNSWRILRKATGEELSGAVETSRLREPAERQLFDHVVSMERAVNPLFSRREYTAALTQLATLKEDVDRFFDSVMVMADDPDVRANRLGLLVRLRGLFLQVADLSRLPG